MPKGLDTGGAQGTWTPPGISLLFCQSQRKIGGRPPSNVSPGLQEDGLQAGQINLAASSRCPEIPTDPAMCPFHRFGNGGKRNSLEPSHLFLFLGRKNHVARPLTAFLCPSLAADSRPVSGSLSGSQFPQLSHGTETPKRQPRHLSEQEFGSVLLGLCGCDPHFTGTKQGSEGKSATQRVLWVPMPGSYLPPRQPYCC